MISKKFLACSLASASLGMFGVNSQAADFRLPAFETAKLSNGLTLYLMERHDVPLIAMRAVVKAGAVNDGSQSGLSNLTGETLLLGSSKYDKKTLDQSFDFRGGRISSATTAESTTLTAEFAKDDASTLMPIIADVLQHPSFN